MHSLHSTKQYAGYTLLEMLMAIAIISIIFPVLFATINSLYESHATSLSQSFALVETTNGIKEIVRDVRSAVYAENGALPIRAMSTNSLTLYSDTDRDGSIEEVRYFLSGTTMYKGVIEPTSTSSYPTNTEIITELTTNIINIASSTPVFRYFNATSTEITTMTNTIDVRRVEVQLIGTSHFWSENSVVTLRSSASIRNLKEVY
jgi:prepilin-type N-terminal cleavage/methylation domain-containing protein